MADPTIKGLRIECPGSRPPIKPVIIRWLYAPDKPAKEVAASLLERLAQQLGASQDKLTFFDIEDQAVPLDEVVCCIQEGRLSVLVGLEEGVLALRVQISQQNGRFARCYSLATRHAPANDLDVNPCAAAEKVTAKTAAASAAGSGGGPKDPMRSKYNRDVRDSVERYWPRYPEDTLVSARLAPYSLEGSSCSSLMRV